MAYLGGLVRPQAESIRYAQGTFSQGIGKDVQEVGFAHTTDEADNDRGGKGRTYKPFCGAKHPAHARCEEVENAFRRIALQAF